MMLHVSSLVLLALTFACASAPEPLPEPVRFPIPIPATRTLDTFAISPDDKWLAYAAESGSDRRRRLFLQPIEGPALDLPAVAQRGAEVGAPGAKAGEGREVIGSTGAYNPFFSPDGNWVAFFARGALWKSHANQPGSLQKICDAPADTAGGSWTADGRIVFAPLGGQGLVEVPVSGGTPAALTRLDPREGEIEHGWPHALPGGGIVFTVTERGRDAHIEALSLTKERKRLAVPAVGQAQFVSTAPQRSLGASRVGSRDGHLVYSYLGNLMAVAFDVDELRTRGVPVAIAKGVQTTSGFGNLGRTGFSVSLSGTLVWLRATAADAKSHLVRVDRNGIPSPLPAPPEIYQTPRISPDGRLLALVVRPGVMTRELRVLDAARPDRVLLAIQGGDNQSPAWNPDSRRLTFSSNRDGLQKIYVLSMTGARRPRPLFSADVSAAQNPASWTRTPPLLAFYEIDPARRRDVFLYRVGESVTPVAATGANERSPTLSPDGQWIAYVSDASGRDEIYVKRLTGSADAQQLTGSGGVEPVWTREGLFYRAGEALMLVGVKDGNIGKPSALFEGNFERDPGANLAGYDVDPRGRFFIMLKSALVPRELRIVRNWGTELVQQVPRR